MFFMLFFFSFEVFWWCLVFFRGPSLYSHYNHILYQHDSVQLSCRRRECACVGLSSQTPNTRSFRWNGENDPSDLGALTKEAIWRGPCGPDCCCVWLGKVWSCRAAEATCGCCARAVWMAGQGPYCLVLRKKSQGISSYMSTGQVFC